MLPLKFRRPVTSSDHASLVVAPHHPDRLRRPMPAAWAAGDDAFVYALTWNVFRTLELIAPSFWLRRLHLRLTGEASLLAPQIMSVRLWPELHLPPIRRIDGRRSDVPVDVVIETEHDVWTILVAREHVRGDHLRGGSGRSGCGSVAGWQAVAPLWRHRASDLRHERRFVAETPIWALT